MMDEDRIKSEGGIEAPNTIKSEKGLDWIGFKTLCNEGGYECQSDGRGLVYAIKNGHKWFSWYKNYATCFDDHGDFSHEVTTADELSDAMSTVNTWLKNQVSSKSDIMKEFEDVTNTDNYHGVKGEFEPIKLMEYIMIEYAKRNIPPEKAMMVAIAIKYLLRAGTKDDFNKEMFKAINFITRARYAKWLPCDFNKKMGGE